jgi:hypothetical protein
LGHQKYAQIVMARFLTYYNTTDGIAWLAKNMCSIFAQNVEEILDMYQNTRIGGAMPAKNTCVGAPPK